MAVRRLALLAFLLLCSCSAFAYQDAGRLEEDAVTSTSAKARLVPHTVRFSGAVRTNGAATAAVTFALYAEPQGGTPLWLETQNVNLDDQGRFTVLIGAATTGGLPVRLFATGAARWLGIRLAQEGAVEQPRVALVSVPYALAAADAQMLNGRPISDFQLTRAAAQASGDATAAGVETSGAVNSTANTVNKVAKFTATDTVGDSLLFDNGTNVGIGTTSPADKLHVNGAIRFGPGSFTAGVGKFYVDAQHGTLLTATTGTTNDLGIVATSGNLLLTNPTGTNNLVLLSGGGFGVNTSNITEKLTVNGGIQFGPSSFSAGAPTLYKDAAHGSVLTGSAGSQNDLALVSRVGNLLLTNPTNTNNLVFFSGGNFGLNTFTPTELLDVNGVVRSAGGIRFGDGSLQTTAAGSPNLSAYQLRVTGTCATGNYVRVINQDGSVTCGTDQTGAGGIVYPYSSGNQSTASGAFTVIQTGSVLLQADPTFASAQTGIPAAIVGKATATTNTAAAVAGFNTSNGPAIVGWNGSTTGNSGESQGVIGISDNPVGIGIDGTASAATGTGIGVRGWANSANGVGVHGGNEVGGLAGKFDGQVQIQGALTMGNIIQRLGGGQVQIGGGIQVTSGGATITGNTSINGTLSVTGTVSKGGGTFKIDHPLDPANKYLYHSFVESPDMMNIYNGVVLLDAKGEAWVTMPEWFQALNMDFRYQLTPIGNPGRRILYIAKEMQGNRFKIAGGRPSAKVSWQVTGIRHDAYANAHRVQVEEQKPPQEQGKYLYPDAFQKSTVAKK